MTLYKAKRSNKEPTHPGELLPDIITALDISKTQFAKDIQISRELLYKIIDKKKAISPETALKLGKYVGNGATIWLNLQRRHDLWIAEKKLKSVLKQIPEKHVAA